MTNDPEFVRQCLFLLSSLGPVEAKRMFGGHGLFLDGIMVALLASGRLFLKTDAESADAFAAAGSQAFTYRRKGKTVALSYWSAPEAAISGPDAMEPWAERAVAAARRVARQRPRKSRTKGRSPRLQTTGNRK